MELAILQCLLQLPLKHPLPQEKQGYFTGLTMPMWFIPHQFGNKTIPTNLEQDSFCFQYLTLKSKTSRSWGKTAFIWGTGDISW